MAVMLNMTLMIIMAVMLNMTLMIIMAVMISMTMNMMTTSQGSKWAARRSSCERPRTYDKFYQKTPGNFQPADERDSAISVCSSEDCDQQAEKEQKKRRRPRRSQSERRVRNRTLTERDVKHLERHL